MASSAADAVSMFLPPSALPSARLPAGAARSFQTPCQCQLRAGDTLTAAGRLRLPKATKGRRGSSPRPHCAPPCGDSSSPWPPSLCFPQALLQNKTKLKQALSGPGRGLQGGAPPPRRHSGNRASQAGDSSPCPSRGPHLRSFFLLPSGTCTGPSAPPGKADGRLPCDPWTCFTEPLLRGRSAHF